MYSTFIVISVITIAFNGFSGIVSLTGRPSVIGRQLEPTMDAVEVPQSWMAFPIGVCKLLGAGILLSGVILAVPLLTALAALGLFGFWCCAAFSHLREAHYDHHLMTTTVMALASATVLLLQVALV